MAGKSQCWEDRSKKIQYVKQQVEVSGLRVLTPAG